MPVDRSAIRCESVQWSQCSKVAEPFFAALVNYSAAVPLSDARRSACQLFLPFLHSKGIARKRLLWPSLKLAHT